MAKKIDFKEFGKNFLIIFAVSFIVLHILSLFLSTWFASFQTLVTKFSLAWMVIFLSVIVYLIYRIVFGLKSFDKTSLFALLFTTALLIAVSFVFKIDYGQLFDMAIVKSQAGSVIGSTIGSLIP